MEDFLSSFLHSFFLRNLGSWIPTNVSVWNPAWMGWSTGPQFAIDTSLSTNNTRWQPNGFRTSTPRGGSLPARAGILLIGSGLQTHRTAQNCNQNRTTQFHMYFRWIWAQIITKTIALLPKLTTKLVSRFENLCFFGTCTPHSEFTSNSPQHSRRSWWGHCWPINTLRIRFWAQKWAVSWTLGRSRWGNSKFWCFWCVFDMASPNSTQAPHN